MNRYILFFFILVLQTKALSQSIFYPKIFNNNIKTLELRIGENQSYSEMSPTLLLNTEDVLFVNFDELSHERKNYYCKLIHCKSNWAESEINDSEFIDGYNYYEINDVQQSINTTLHYTHYSFEIPNENIKPKISGNYIIQVFESGNDENVCFQARFKIAEEIVDIQASVRAETDIDIKKKHQQIDLEISTKNIEIDNQTNDIIVNLSQNQRIDNDITLEKPNFFSREKLIYKNNKACIFEAGNEYRTLDISNIRILGDNVKSIEHIKDYYHVELYPEKNRNKAYYYTQDINGKYVINLQKNFYEDKIEADYMLVHFDLPTEFPFFDGKIYLIGGFNFQLLDENSEMKYNNTTQSYNKTILLKQGGYNYQYLFVPTRSSVGFSEKIEGSFWQTENEYEILVYYKPQGCRFERIIGYKKIKNNM